ncbi:MAG: hypothetical protein EHM49_03615 [Deltaproteobacteria bacterium]|nr:MAG: hypothetical protein EHM49_03615 [Deltaproteobacteria bacterium]
MAAAGDATEIGRISILPGNIQPHPATDLYLLSHNKSVQLVSLYILFDEVLLIIRIKTATASRFPCHTNPDDYFPDFRSKY